MFWSHFSFLFVVVFSMGPVYGELFDIFSIILAHEILGIFFILRITNFYIE